MNENDSQFVSLCNGCPVAGGENQTGPPGAGRRAGEAGAQKRQLTLTHRLRALSLLL